MPDDRKQLIAYLATLGALVTVFIAALVMSAIAPGIEDKLEVFGLGTITGGLIGVLRIPAKTPGSTQADANLATVIDKLPPATIGTGPAVPVSDAADATDR